MPIFEPRVIRKAVTGYIAKLPKWAWAAIGAGVVLVVLLAVFATAGSTYVPLYQGLGSRRGGQVIGDLQKLGIPYQLNTSGSVISVPAGDLARARLQLGKMGVPGDSGSEAWTQLEKGSLTRGAAATDALSRRALEGQLEKVVDRINGVAGSHITLAIPQSTPFLGDQPKPKASVLLHTVGAGVSQAQAVAIAGLVANSVPGLSVERVTVTDQHGDVLAPTASTSYGRARQELAFRNALEATAAQRISTLLVPLIGTHNFRVTVAASVNFDSIGSRNTSYGPGHYSAHEKLSTKQHTGATQKAIGVPGALSNQPPPQASAAARNAQGNGSAANAGARTGAQPTLPRSRSDHNDTTYDVNSTITTTHGSPWHVRALSASIVLNERVLANPAKTLTQVKKVVTGALTAPKDSVYVAAVPFAMAASGAPVYTGMGAFIHNRALTHSLLALLAALFLWLGIAHPLSRWLRGIVFGTREPLRAGTAAAAATAGGNEPGPAPSTPWTDSQRRAARATRVASEQPKETADLVRQWLSGDGSAAHHNGATANKPTTPQHTSTPPPARNKEGEA